MGAVHTLYLLRHAKSSWREPAVADGDRPLAPRGRRAVGRIARHVASQGVRPELVLCSSARRTRETLDGLLPVLGPDADIRVEDGVYGATAEELLARLRSVDPHVASVLVVGHNPGLQELAALLSGDGERPAMQQLKTTATWYGW